MLLTARESRLRHLRVLLRRLAVGIFRQDFLKEREAFRVAAGREELLAFVQVAPALRDFLRRALFSGTVGREATARRTSRKPTTRRTAAARPMVTFQKEEGATFSSFNLFQS